MNKTNILFFGHDLKFLTHVINHFKAREDYIVKVLEHKGHVIQDYSGLSKELLDADIIFCEWGLGNLSWLSKNKFPDQKIIVRIHLQEFTTNFLNDTDWTSVEKAILVGPEMVTKFENAFPAFDDKCRLIYNIIDTESFNMTKNGDAFFNIGLLGVLPKRKWPHLGLELLNRLKSIDSRFKLNIKSKKPEHLDWVWRRDDERTYYNSFYHDIEKLGLQDSVIWEAHGTDVQEWFRKIGFILSPSEFESFHMAIPEGMASGAIPIIRNWQGADLLYPKKFIFKDIEQAVNIILKYQPTEKRESESGKLKIYVRDKFGMDVILKQYEQLFAEVLSKQKTAITTPQLRGIYQQLNQEQSSSIESLNKQYSQAEFSIRELKQNIDVKTQEAERLKIEVAERNRKVDSIISIADEMKLQLADGREREKEMNESILVFKDQLAEYSKELTASADREKLQHIRIAQLSTVVEEKAKLIEIIQIQLAELKQQLLAASENEKAKELRINQLKQQLLAASESEKVKEVLISQLKQQLLAASESEQAKEMLISQLNEEKVKQNEFIEAINAQLEDLNQQLVLARTRGTEKDSLLNDLSTKLIASNKSIEDWENKWNHQSGQIKELQSQLNQQTKLIEQLNSKTKDQQEYILYLEKGFFNKLISISKKFIKR